MVVVKENLEDQGQKYLKKNLADSTNEFFNSSQFQSKVMIGPRNEIDSSLLERDPQTDRQIQDLENRKENLSRFLKAIDEMEF